MVKKIFLALFVYSTVIVQVQAKSLSKNLWPDLDINNPKLSKSTAMQQCQKSLMYAPRMLESWCEKAYEMGAWEALLYIGYHTGDGSRYVNEVKRRVLKNENLAIRKLAWLYDGGLFIEKDLKEAARLYELFLTQAKEPYPILLRSIHYDLAKIYTKLEDWPNVIINAQYVIDQKLGDGSDTLAKALKEDAVVAMNN
ncbi:hypothetical protein [Pseudoalteromonas sp. 1_2015MBL_MicDiv]|uniref:hypothetical protein n=2 Tax=unclassified Pseudoalteromonas TaxID=194690 RepID=UPI000BC074DB|nr:hypothetical protein [Pseudoalteromonas sp. 1_2015MBL_MicDiv]ATG79576.1 hypothetical protein AOR04_18665 [Pseudoalteromonas sp. 1_2015MBL_MicDiv]